PGHREIRRTSQYQRRRCGGPHCVRNRGGCALVRNTEWRRAPGWIRRVDHPGGMHKRYLPTRGGRRLDRWWHARETGRGVREPRRGRSERLRLRCCRCRSHRRHAHRLMKHSTPDVIELLSALIRFESLSHQEGPIADFVFDMLDVPGVSVARYDNNVVAQLGNGNRSLLLNSHLDVVPPSSNHPYDPFEPTKADGRLFGRGSVDAKASVASMITAFRSI